MSKSKSFGPGAYDLLNGTLIHSTWSAVKPSCSATAYATADSKPLPFVGSFWLNHGSYAGESVPTVSWPAVRSGSDSVAHSSAAGSLASRSRPGPMAVGPSDSSSGAHAETAMRSGRAATARDPTQTHGPSVGPGSVVVVTFVHLVDHRVTRPRPIIQWLTGTVTTNATASPAASAAQNSQSVRPAAIAPGTARMMRVVDDLHHQDRDGVGRERDPDGRTEVQPGASYCL